LVAQSGANDGLGFPFLYLAIYLVQMPTGSAIGKWAYYIMAYEILLSIIIGFVVGYVARKLLKIAEKK
jgi:NhaP-type Na+/H+ or K+/H+ antiporter